jgi:hypothetical protein
MFLHLLESVCVGSCYLTATAEKKAGQLGCKVPQLGLLACLCNFDSTSPGHFLGAGFCFFGYEETLLSERV